MSEREPQPYGFPYPPYDVQIELMHQITKALDDRAVALLESPTGTGKTLSVICATMSWLLDHRKDPKANGVKGTSCCGSRLLPSFDQPTGDDDTDDEPEWVRQHFRNKAEEYLRELEARRARTFDERVQNAFKIHATVKVGTIGKKIPRLNPREKRSETDTLGCSDEPSTFTATSNTPTIRSSSSAVNHRRTASVRTALDGDLRFLIDDEFVDKATLAGDNDRYLDHNPNIPVAPSNDSREIDEENARDREPRLRLIFATRTHTQLAQFIGEVRKTKFGASALTLDLAFDDRLKGTLPLPLSIITLGSRKVMCVNEDVKSLPSATAVADRCQELLTSGSPDTSKVSTKRPRTALGKTPGCPFKDDSAEAVLRDAAIVHMYDVEEMTNLGRNVGGCPYFATRAAVATGAVDVLGVPYSVILHKPTREALGITVDDKTILVFDEAHNIPNAIHEMHAATITFSDLDVVRAAVSAYKEKFASRLAARNMFSINQIISLIDGFVAVLKNPPRKYESNVGTRVVTATRFIFDARVDNINLFVISKFIRNSRLFQKLLGFVDVHSAQIPLAQNSSGSHANSLHKSKHDDKTESNDLHENKDELKRNAKHSLFAFETFIHAVNSVAEDCKVAIVPATSPEHVDNQMECSQGYLRCFIIRPGPLFSSAVDSARAILLVGGTLSPRDVIKGNILSDLSPRTVLEFECDHVVPSKNLAAFVVSGGPSGKEFEFTYRNRDDSKMMLELGLALVQLAGVSPGGFVVFFPSYVLLNLALDCWNSSDIRRRLEDTKPLFCESRGHCDAWPKYCQEIDKDKHRGAFLFAVMGGRLSEGINFSDELGRVVVVVGMPYPNINDPETAEILNTLDNAACRSEYLENVSMTVINQAIGRALRNRSDYASIILCDRRFSKPNTITKLPKYVRRSFSHLDTFVNVKKAVSTFFKIF